MTQKSRVWATEYSKIDLCNDHRFVAGVDWATGEDESREAVYVVDPAQAGKYILLGYRRANGIFVDVRKFNSSDAPALSQPQDNSPMLSKNHKRK